MDNESDLNLDEIESNVEKKLEIKNRYQQLSEKVKTEAHAKEAAEKGKAEAEAKMQQAEKTVEFYRNFNQISSKHPNAIGYQDQILERVNKGYDLEEAALAVLAKEGKLGQSYEPPRRENPAGGSASTAITDTGDKDPADMSQDERRSALNQLEKEGWDPFRR